MAEPLRHPPARPGWIDRPHEILDIGDLTLESGAVIRNAHISYVVHGEPDRAGLNTILVLPAIGATHHRLDFLIGPGNALDPRRHRIVCVDAIGNGLAISPSNSRLQPGMRFPRFTVRDMVASQLRLIEALGVRRLHAVCGASMGGMQALQWGASHPQRMEKIVAMTPMARTSPWSCAMNELSRQALLLDPAWNGERFTERPRQGFALWSGIMRVLASRTPEALARSLAGPGSVVSYLEQMAEDAQEGGPDPIDWIYQTWAYDSHDLSSTPGCGGTLVTALGHIAARTLILAPPLDLYNPADHGRKIAALMPRARFVEIPSIEGHQAASGIDAADVAFLRETIGGFIEDP